MSASIAGEQLRTGDRHRRKEATLRDEGTTKRSQSKQYPGTLAGLLDTQVLGRQGNGIRQQSVQGKR